MIYTIAGKLKSIIPGFIFNALVNVYKKAESSYTHFRLPFKIKRAEKYHAIAIEELKKKNAGKLYLAVSHGIFNKGFEVLDCFDGIFTTNSFKDIENENVEVITLKIE